MSESRQRAAGVARTRAASGSPQGPPGRALCSLWPSLLPQGKNLSNCQRVIETWASQLSNTSNSMLYRTVFQMLPLLKAMTWPRNPQVEAYKEIFSSAH